MTENSEPKHTGRPSLAEITGEETIRISAKITRSMMEYVDARQGFSRAGFIRSLIRASMLMREGIASGEFDMNEVPAADILESVDRWERSFSEIFDVEIPDEE